MLELSKSWSLPDEMRYHARERVAKVKRARHMISLLSIEYDIALNSMFNEVSNRLHMIDPILRLFPPKEMVHGGAYRQVSTPRIVDTALRDYRATVDVQLSMLLQTDAVAFRDFLFNLVTAVQEQQRTHTLEVISDTSKAVGTHIERADRNFWDAYIEMLEKIELGFDHSGTPCAIDIPSALATKLTRPTEEQLEGIATVVERKRQEHFANKRCRRLAMQN